MLSASFWHILADAGRGVKLLDRLSEHYRAAAAGRPVGSEGALTSDTRLFHSPADLMEAMATEWVKCCTAAAVAATVRAELVACMHIRLTVLLGAGFIGPTGELQHC